jgi:hypothetical protein
MRAAAFDLFFVALAAILLALLLGGCDARAVPPYTTTGVTTEPVAPIPGGGRVYRIADFRYGVVCYMPGSGETIACAPMHAGKPK